LYHFYVIDVMLLSKPAVT